MPRIRLAAAPPDSGRPPRPVGTALRPAFTLIELLVAIGILLLLATITVTSVNLAMTGDRTRSTARQIQSYLTGARDRAIHAQAPRGVRFLFDPKPGDPTDLRNRTARSMVYIGPISPDLGTLDLAADGRTLTNTSVGLWDSLAARGVLVAGTRIRVPSGPGPASDGLWYQVDDASFQPTGALATPNTLLLATTHLDLTGTATPGLNYELELAPAVLPNQEVAVFAPGIVIDLANSLLPSGWSTRPQRMDLLFAPSGSVSGPVAAVGKVHLVLRDVRDMELGLVPGDLNRKGDELVVTVFSRTGHVASSPLYVAAPGDPFRYAETGEVAK